MQRHTEHQYTIINTPDFTVVRFKNSLDWRYTGVNFITCLSRRTGKGISYALKKSFYNFFFLSSTYFSSNINFHFFVGSDYKVMLNSAVKVVGLEDLEDIFSHFSSLGFSSSSSSSSVSSSVHSSHSGRRYQYKITSEDGLDHFFCW